MPTSNRHLARTAQRKAFTLLEVILAIALAGFVLAAATSMITSVSNIWATRQERGFFKDHADGVAEFLTAALNQSGTEIALGEDSTDSSTSTETETSEETDSVEISVTDGESEDTSSDSSSSSEGSSLLRVSETPVGWARPPGYPEYQDPLLNFSFQSAPALLLSPDMPVDSMIQAYLYFEKDEGLSLIWYSSLQEESEDLEDLRRSSISSLVSGIQYIYWDERFERWETEDSPKKDEEGDSEDFLLPRYLLLSFSYEDETITRKVTIPIPSQYAVLF
jgi:prepilin-type N-terminal cleavage/methylation domain